MQHDVCIIILFLQHKVFFKCLMVFNIMFPCFFDKFIIIPCFVVTGFIKTCLLTDATCVIATFSEQKGDDDDGCEQQKNKHNISLLYKLSDDVLLFVASSYINERNAFALLKEVGDNEHRTI